MISSAPVAAQADADAMRVRCEGAAKWAPVRLPEAGVNAAIPCNDAELNSYKNANEQRKRTEGLVGCEKGGRTYLVMYLVNTPPGFFEQFGAGSAASPASNFQVAGHRVARSAEVEAGETAGKQLIEIDASRSILMWSSSKVAKDPEFSKITSCFFNSFEFTPR
jgi:hypothetical protein